MSSLESGLLRGEFVVPTIGSSGLFTLKAPFNTLLVAGINYSCQALRKISEYTAANEDVKELVYTPAQAPDSLLQTHQEQDMLIASLQAEQGQWVYVPVDHIDTYPDPNGISYRALALTVHLPPMPVARDYNFLISEVQALMLQSLGVTAQVDLIETSAVYLVPQAAHESAQTDRTAAMTSGFTDAQKLVQAQALNAELNTKLTALETYIIEHIPSP